MFAPGGRFRLRVSAGTATLANRCSNVSRPEGRTAEGERGAGSDQEAEGDLRLHSSLCGEDGVSADGAGDRQSGGAALVLDRARASGQPGEDRAAEARSVEAAGDR